MGRSIISEKMVQLEEGTLITLVQERIMIRKRGVAVYKAGLVEVGNGQWCYIDDKGKQLLYLQNIDGKTLLF